MSCLRTCVRLHMPPEALFSRLPSSPLPLLSPSAAEKPLPSSKCGCQGWLVGTHGAAAEHHCMMRSLRSVPQLRHACLAAPAHLPGSPAPPCPLWSWCPRQSRAPAGCCAPATVGPQQGVLCKMAGCSHTCSGWHTGLMPHTASRSSTAYTMGCCILTH